MRPTPASIWAERYDRDLADIFAAQDEITKAVTIAVAPAVAQAELQRAVRSRPESLDAWTCYQRGLWHVGRAIAEDNTRAEQFFQQAIQLDPNFGGGYRGLAIAYRESASIFQKRSLSEAQSSAEALARQAAALDANDAEGGFISEVQHFGAAITKAPLPRSSGRWR